MIPGDSNTLPGTGATIFRLEGGGDLGEVPAEDVGLFILELVRVVARAAGHAVGRPVKETGRWESIVKSASRVRLESVTSGSVQVAFVPSKSEVFQMGDNLGLDAETVSQRALVIVRASAGPDADAYPDVAKAWTELAQRLGVGQRYGRISITAEDGEPVVIDSQSLGRLAEVAERTIPGVNADHVRGVLFAADFEKLTAKLRTSSLELVDVEFDLEHADAIKEALRDLTAIQGHATYDRRTHRLISVHVEEIVRPVQLEAEDFWTDRTIPQLLAEQGVGPADPAALRIEGVSEEDWAMLLEELAR
jgi:hypothetical protein